MRSPHIRVVLILLLLVLGTLLVAPGVSQASVRARYRADYKSRLQKIQQEALRWQSFYLTFSDGTQVFVDLEKEILNTVPVDYDALHAVEQRCAEVAGTYYGLPITWKRMYSAQVNAYRARAKLYFATLKQQRRFRQQCDKLVETAGTKMIMLGILRVCDAYNMLSIDPPDFEGCTASLDVASDYVTDGSLGFDAAHRAILKML